MATPHPDPSPLVPPQGGREKEAPAPPSPSPLAGEGRGGGARPRGPLSVEDLLFAEPFGFDFFQAVRLLERIDPARRSVGRAGPPRAEAVRFRAHLSLSFPASTIFDLARPSETLPVPALTVAFLGLTGPSGALPRHYTELLLKIDREGRWPERDALREWLDQFNHRLISHFYRAWEKYRFPIPYERGDYARTEPDAFTQSLFSLVGLGVPTLRNRMKVAAWREVEGEPKEQVLARVDDLSLLYYSGYLAHRPRCAVSLEALLQDYFQLPLRVEQFRGQWLVLAADNQSRLAGEGESNNELGVSLVVGERVWDVQNKVRIRLGPLTYPRFMEFLPDPAPVAERKGFFLLSHLVRLYVGPELDFDIQLVLLAAEVPECSLASGAPVGPRLGWNTWIRTGPMPRDAEDAAFEGNELVYC